MSIVTESLSYLVTSKLYLTMFTSSHFFRWNFSIHRVHHSMESKILRAEEGEASIHRPTRIRSAIFRVI
jgi:hypothetical protein